MRRPPEKNEEFRLDRLLQRKAKEGVMIYIVVYKEMSLALTIDSAHTKKWLQGLHPNIIGKIKSVSKAGGGKEEGLFLNLDRIFRLCIIFTFFKLVS